MDITPEILLASGFREARRDSTKDANMPPEGRLVVCYHKLFGITVGYYAGRNTGFILPYLRETGYNWATHWQYHK